MDNDSNSYAVGSEGCCQAWVSKTDIDVTCYRSIVGFNLRIVDSRDSLFIKKAHTEVQDKYEKGGLGAVLF